LQYLKKERQEVSIDYFFSIAVALKLDKAHSRNEGNISISTQELYENALELNLKHHQWPAWISKQIIENMDKLNSPADYGSPKSRPISPTPKSRPTSPTPLDKKNLSLTDRKSVTAATSSNVKKKH